MAPSMLRAGLPGVVHELRHADPSLLIEHGKSVEVVQERPGHTAAAETLDTCSHLWPDADDRTREDIDRVLGAPADPGRTAALRNRRKVQVRQ